MNKNDSQTPLVLLHGALGSKEQFDDLLPKLEDKFDIYRLDFEGHGEAGPTDSPFRMEYLAENVLGYLDEYAITKANFFGFSMGGYVALILAKEYPEKVEKVATLGTILQWNSEVAEQECRYLHPEKIKEKVPHFAEKLDNRHQAGWERVVERTREMLYYLGSHPTISEKDWKNLSPQIRLHVGDRDTTAGIEQTMQVYKKMDKAELCVLPNTKHPFEEVKKELLTTSLTDFYLH